MWPSGSPSAVVVASEEREDEEEAEESDDHEDSLPSSDMADKLRKKDSTRSQFRVRLADGQRSEEKVNGSWRRQERQEGEVEVRNR